MPRYKDADGRYHLVDSAGNHFINSKCVNPKEDEQADIGPTFNRAGVKPSLEVTGHVSKFSYYDGTLKKDIFVDTGKEDW